MCDTNENKNGAYVYIITAIHNPDIYRETYEQNEERPVSVSHVGVALTYAEATEIEAAYTTTSLAAEADLEEFLCDGDGPHGTHQKTKATGKGKTDCTFCETYWQLCDTDDNLLPHNKKHCISNLYQAYSTEFEMDMGLLHTHIEKVKLGNVHGGAD